ncbi:MAG TPA: UvrD-helicase domain-containing protein [Longimicrobiales bacterium]
MHDWVPPDQAHRERILNDLDTNLLVEAGAGSGKTTAMVGRMVALVRTGRAKVEEIAAVTFTRKAAAELRERFQVALEKAYREAVGGRGRGGAGGGTPEPGRALGGEGAGGGGFRGDAGRAAGGGRHAGSGDDAPADAPGGDAPASDVRGGDSSTGADPVERERLGRALASLDRCFIGTIHSFCGRLLRERPLEAGVPPDFGELMGPEEERLRAESWGRFLERLSGRDSRLLRGLAAVGLRPAQLRGAFEEISANPDVQYPAAAVPRPGAAEIAPVRAALEALLGDALRLMPEVEPEGGWDDLQLRVRRLDFSRRFPGWRRPVDFFDALDVAVAGRGKVTQNRWGETKEAKAAAKALGERWAEFAAEDGAARRLLHAWQAHRYRIAIRFARAAAGHYAAERRRLGRLDFQDLLLRAAALLRRDPEARRELGRRFRYLLVDEFQDTDPVQAEVLFLLASDGADPRWTHATPRAGALFVVGDPKQSIYRFRRADITVYNQVKARFAQWGAVLTLTANFRSRKPIETLVNRVFAGLFPAGATEHQAAFAPLAVAPGRAAREGVFWYDVPLEGGRATPARLAAVESEIVASWIRERLDRGERRPGDFMILTRTKHELSTFARALEARNIPVQVSGSGVGVEEELSELVLLLRALADPGDPVLTLAVLNGLFFGLSYEDLYRHVAAGGEFSFLADAPEGPVGTALRVMREFWTIARGVPADVAVATIVERLGVLPFAAAGELGATRAGALVYALDALRVAGLDGATSLPDAIEVLERALAQEVDTPLAPGEEDVVRVMNLHKAKGLEANVVILVVPAAPPDHEPDRRVTRGADGRAVGYTLIRDATRRFGGVIARPPEWETHAAEEAPFREAEEVRLLYVAATRAAEELVIARCDRTADTSCWRIFHDVLDDGAVATRLDLAAAARPEREALTEDAASITARIAALRDTRAGLARETYRIAPVTARAKRGGEGAPPPAAGSASGPGSGAGSGGGAAHGRGTDWGSAVHRAIEAAARGVAGDVLRAVCRSALLEYERPLDARGEPIELDELVALVERLGGSPIWARARAAGRMLVEAPFCIALGPEEATALGLADAGAGAATEVVEGVIDLAFRENDGAWVICDFKTDAVDDPAVRAARVALYRRQVDMYAACWERLTGEPVKQRVLLFTSDGTEEAW